MIRPKTFASLFVLPLALSMTFFACGGSSNDSPAVPPSPSLQVTPTSYSFGAVTPGNTPAPLEVEIRNDGDATLNVSNISVSDTDNFTLNLSGGSNPCGNVSLDIAAGDNCTAVVAFQPQSIASFNTALSINSNDPDIPVFNLPLNGSQEPITALNVRINQIAVDCPSGVVTAYVSVTDQGGYPVITLATNDFSITETGGYTGPPASSPFVENSATISTALVLDYSASISDFPSKVHDMEEGAVHFVDQLGANDEAEVIKFAELVEVLQPFTSDKDLLTTAIRTPFLEGARTAIFDACKKAVDDTSDFGTKDRKAVIVISDGKDSFSTLGIDALIDEALLKNVPLFSVGLGDDIDVATLTRMADDTGGQFYEATTSDNLNTIYQQLSDVLFTFQYILTYTSGLPAGTTADVTVSATLNGITGFNARSITQCP